VSCPVRIFYSTKVNELPLFGFETTEVRKVDAVESLLSITNPFSMVELRFTLLWKTAFGRISLSFLCNSAVLW
jgi:hypothetical protein